jgi:hypothetical protein
LTEGVLQLHAILTHVTGIELGESLCPAERIDADLKAGIPMAEQR